MTDTRFLEDGTTRLLEDDIGRLLESDGYIPPPDPTGTTNRDDVILADVAERLRTTGVFEAILVGCSPSDDQGPGGDRIAGIAWIDLEGWEERTDGDGGDSVDVLHMGMMLIWIEVRSDNYLQMARRLARLEAVVQNALDGQSLADITEAAMTFCKKGRRDRTVMKGGRRQIVQVEWAYHTESYAGHDPMNAEDSDY